MPLITTSDVQSALRTLTTATSGGSTLEVFTEFPADEDKISEGFYVARVYQADRSKAAVGTSPGGSIYFIKDRIEMYIVSQQVNPFLDGLLALFPTLLDNAIFQGYHIREHSIDQVYVKNSERYRIIFDLTRLQVI